MTDVQEAVARAMREAVIRDDEGEFPRLFDLLDFSGENKAHTVVNGLAAVAITAHTKALLDGAGELVERLKVWSDNDRVCGHGGRAEDCDQAAATIAAQAAEIATAREEGILSYASLICALDPAAIARAKED